MTFRRVLAAILIVAVMYLAAPSVFALEIETGEIDVIIFDEEKNRRIDELFAVRSRLELDFEANEEEINSIDMQLAALGVEEISYTELQSILGTDAVPQYEIRPDPNTQWSSRRLVTTYNGQHYELQIVEGVPLNENSELYSKKGVYRHKKKDISAGSFEVFRETGLEIVGGIPLIGPWIARLITVMDVLQDINSTSTVIDNLTGETEVRITTHAKFIYAKRYQEPDYGNQATCYMGTYVTYSVDMENDATWFVDGVEHHVENVKTIIDEVRVSDDYDDYSEAVKKYHYYRNDNIDYGYDYRISLITVEIFEEEKTFVVPFQYPGII